jgi:hypothetical protein
MSFNESCFPLIQISFQILTWIKERSATPPALDVDQPIAGGQQVERKAGRNQHKGQGPKGQTQGHIIRSTRKMRMFYV